ncbi:geranylgeranyl pyrophosphate synthase [Streptomyces dioscori]|uniref:Geranylgeranyl pyrophosphate synthase n=1 Tax=Streptomyces dioscori TaxID=2109333 RepID=A0A2P8QEV4_9ACTN|nr:polyprenyl synthetase family protein [Streptomyces dioscori]PSM44728.1 geranylgeranyl pyrophosphate synthase [Streptomyces dioscori]
MLGLRPTAAEAVLPVDSPLTALEAVRAVEAELGHVLDTKLRTAFDVDEVFAQDVAGRVTAFVRRGGKRLRSAFAWCGWRAAGGSGDPTALLRTAAALELVQACALMHDDVMDGSPLRRGAPAVHVELARMHRAARMTGSPEVFSTSVAILAGDLALVWADDVLTETALASPHGTRLFHEWQAMRTEMVAGQYRDIHAQAAGSSGVDEAVSIATLKSALYTVERPLTLGASLTGGDEHTLSALRSAGRCAGLAFQLRDDLLGTYGDPDMTGKPADDDLRTRKLTYLLAVGLWLADAAGDAEAADALSPVTGIGAVTGTVTGTGTGFDLGVRSDDAVDRMRAALERTGARDVVESKISELAATSVRHFEGATSDPVVRREFTTLVERASGVALGHSGEAA